MRLMRLLSASFRRHLRGYARARRMRWALRLRNRPEHAALPAPDWFAEHTRDSINFKSDMDHCIRD